jgi:cobalt/nickel transport protein
MKGFKILAAAAALACLSAPAQAHFQMIYTPQANLEKPGDIPILLLFAHPFENGPVMDMGQPRQFFVIAKNKKTDLLDKLKPVTFKGAENSAAAFETKFPIRALGDYIFVLDPAPFWEPTENHFIHQITKSYVNMGEAPTVWADPVGLPTEIVPLNKPTAIIAGSTFSGQVLTRGKPAANIEIEIEYVAAEPDLATLTPKPPTVTPPPGGTLVAHTDANGVFTFGIPRAGYWGFSAIDSGPAKTFGDKDQEEDAVIWIHANDFK